MKGVCHRVEREARAMSFADYQAPQHPPPRNATRLPPPPPDADPSETPPTTQRVSQRRHKDALGTQKERRVPTRIRPTEGRRPRCGRPTSSRRPPHAPPRVHLLRRPRSHIPPAASRRSASKSKHTASSDEWRDRRNKKSPPLNADRMVERLLLRRKHSRPLSTRQR